MADFNFALVNTSPSSASTAAGADVSDPVTESLAGYRSMRIEGDLVGATGGVLDVYIQSSLDKGVTWTDLVHFPQLAAGAAAVRYAVSLSRGFGASVPVVVGKGTTPALAVNTAVPGEWGDRIRVLFVAGAGTSAGASQTIRVYLHD